MKMSLQLQGAAGLPPTFEHNGPAIHIGRDPQLDLVFKGAAGELVSWKHARIDLSSSGASLTDLGSTNGTFLNSQQVTGRMPLHVGDRIQLGKTGPVLKITLLELSEPPRRRAPAPEPALAARASQPAAVGSPPPAPPPRPATPPPGNGAVADAPAQAKAAAPRRMTGATLFVGLVNNMQRRQRRLLIVSAAAMLVLAGVMVYLLWRPPPPAPPPPPSDTDIYKRVLHSTGWIVVARMKSMGTGALIDRQRRLLLTAHHVVLGHENEQIFVFFPAFDSEGKAIANRRHYLDYGNKDYVRVTRIVKKDPGRDLALLELETVPDDVVALPLAERSPEPGERIHTVGNPGDGAMWNPVPGTVRQVLEYTKKFEDQQITACMIETTVALNPGDSGGPMVNDKMELVGVNSSGLRHAQQINHCIDIQEVRKLLEGLSH